MWLDVKKIGTRNTVFDVHVKSIEKVFGILLKSDYIEFTPTASFYSFYPNEIADVSGNSNIEYNLITVKIMLTQIKTLLQ